MIRAKFYVSEKGFYGGQGTGRHGGYVKLRPVYSNNPEDENKAFWEATPSGEITMSIKSSALDMFEEGKTYYVDFTPTDNE